MIEAAGLQRPRRITRVIGPGIATLVMLAVLLGLGTWQLQRLAWKRGILAQIDAAEAAPAIVLPRDPVLFQKVRVTGRFRAGAPALFGADVRATPQGEAMGARVIVPLDRTDGEPILVDRGWAPLALLPGLAPPSGTVTVEGYVRPAEHARWFSAVDDPAQRRFYTLDPAVIGAAVGVSHAAPFTLIALGSAPKDLFPDPARALPRPPNDHLSYAATWYGLAVVLLVVFALWSRKVLRA